MTKTSSQNTSIKSKSKLALKKLTLIRTDISVAGQLKLQISSDGVTECRNVQTIVIIT